MQSLLERWSPVLSQSSLWSGIFIWLGWGIVWLLSFLVDAAESLFNAVYRLIDFTNYAGIGQFFNNSQLRLFTGVLMAGALVFLGITLVISSEKKPKVLQNILIFVFVITALPTFMSMMNDVTIAGVDFIRGNNQASISSQIIANNVVDFKHIDRVGVNQFRVENGIVVPRGNNRINNFVGSRANNVRFIQPGEQFEADRNNNDIFRNHLVLDANGNVSTAEITSQGWFGILGAPWYYRYRIDFLAIYISLIATALALFFAAFKVARIIWELAVNGFLAVIFAASDLTSGQKTVQVLKNIGSSYVVLFLVAVLIRFYLLGAAFVSQTISNPLIAAFILIAFAFAVIDGPNIIERILGIDAGLGSGVKAMGSLMMAGRAARGAGRLATAPVRAGMAVTGTKGFFANISRRNTSGAHKIGQKNESKNDITSKNNINQKTGGNNNSGTGGSSGGADGKGNLSASSSPGGGQPPNTPGAGSGDVSSGASTPLNDNLAGNTSGSGSDDGLSTSSVGASDKVNNFDSMPVGTGSGAKGGGGAMPNMSKKDPKTQNLSSPTMDNKVGGSSGGGSVSQGARSLRNQKPSSSGGNIGGSHSSGQIPSKQNSGKDKNLPGGNKKKDL